MFVTGTYTGKQSGLRARKGGVYREFRLRRSPCIILRPGTWDGKKVSKLTKVKEV
jgi:hypothetical protein